MHTITGTGEEVMAGEFQGSNYVHSYIYCLFYKYNIYIELFNVVLI